MIGEFVHHYRILEKVGGGAMGIVYKAEDTHLKRHVALKFLAPDLTRDPEARSRFIHEAQAASALDHPNICNVHEIGETEDGQTYICMSYYDGQTLQEMIQRGPLQVPQAIEIARQIAEGLREAHARGIVHRDIKPANIIITCDGSVKILDFGLAKLRGLASVTKTGSTAGTVAYMSPEQAKGEEVDHRTDLWSLGVLLYEMLTGERPFASEFEQAVVYAIIYETPAPIEKFRHDLPASLTALLRHALAKKPGDRYQSAAKMISDLRTCASGRRLSLFSRHSSGKKQKLLLAGVVLAVILSAWMTVLFTTGKGDVLESLAVLPMQNLSRDSTLDYFSDGITAELITHLYTVRDLKVRSWQTVIAYKQTRKPPTEIARELHVNAILVSTFVRSGKRIRLTFQLAEALTDRNLWGHTYDCDMGDILEVLADVSQSVVKDIHVKLTSQEQQVLSQARSVDPLAYELYLRARAQFPQVPLLSKHQWRLALRYAQDAVSLDSTHSTFHSGVANVYLQGAGVGYVSTDELADEGERAVRRALVLDSTSAEAWYAYGRIRAFLWQWEPSTSAFARALELGPGNAHGRLAYGFHLLSLNRGEEGILQAKTAAEIDPSIDPDGAIVGVAYGMARNFDEAIRILAASIKRNPKSPVLRCFIGQVYAVKGMTTDALQNVEQSMAIGVPEENVVLLLNNAITYALCGERTKAETILHRYMVKRPGNEVDPYWVAAVYAALDMPKEAFSWLERAYQSHNHFMVYLTDVPWDNLRTDPRFRDVLKKTGLDAYW
jgi:eukaryotic-like serine/threonine-protein kinase